MTIASPVSPARTAPRAIISHAPWLVVVLVAAAFGQWFVMHQGAVPIVTSDSLDYYLSGAHALPSIHGLVDAKVPPGYPLLLAGIFLVAGRDNLDAVMIFQAVLFVAAILELYALLTTLGAHRALAAGVTAMLAAAPWLVQWERYILAETFSFWAVITLLLAFTRLLRRPTLASALVCGLVGAVIPLTRPALALVPASLLAVLIVRAVMSDRVGTPRSVLAMVAVVFGLVSYVPVAGYIAANAAVNGCYCYTSIGNLNFFGKIYEYGMKDFPADAQYATLAEQVRTSNGINRFLENYPQYASQNYAPLGAYARSQFLRYPNFTLRVSLTEIKRTLTLDIEQALLLQDYHYACRGDPALPYPLVTADALHASDLPYCPKVAMSVGTVGEDANRVIYGLVFLAYVMLPLSLALGIALVLAEPTRNRAWLLLTSAFLVAAVIVSSALAGYTAFDRLKVPVDGVILAAAALALCELWFVLVTFLRMLRPARSA